MNRKDSPLAIQFPHKQGLPDEKLEDWTNICGMEDPAGLRVVEPLPPAVRARVSE
jgi:hypothetical protein